MSSESWRPRFGQDDDTTSPLSHTNITGNTMACRHRHTRRGDADFGVVSGADLFNSRSRKRREEPPTGVGVYGRRCGTAGSLSPSETSAGRPPWTYLWTYAKLMLIASLVLSFGTKTSDTASTDVRASKGSENNGCSAAMKVIDDRPEISVKIIPEQQLHVCSTLEAYTCCTLETETEFVQLSRADFNKKILNRTTAHRQVFASRFTRFNTFINELVNASRHSLHDMFIKTYGLLYQQNAVIFGDLFADFRAYIDGRNIDLTDALDRFFVELMRRMFVLVNDVELADLTEAYVTCMTGRIDRLRPFGDVPGKLATQVKRSFVAARTLVRGLSVGRDVISSLAKMQPTSSCVSALTRMSYCPYCRGLSDARPCRTFCLNVARGCLAGQADVNDVWNNYIDEMLKLAARFKGPFNIANVVSPIDVKLSDAIMNFQENAEPVSSKIFHGCGLVPGSIRRRRRQADGVMNHRNESVSTPVSREMRRGTRRKPAQFSLETALQSRPERSEDTHLERIVDELTQRLQQSKDLWKLQLTQAVCGPINAVETSTPVNVTLGDLEDNCWNGHGTSRYTHPLVGEGTLNQTSNPEVEHQVPRPATVAKVILQLRQTIITLRQAYNGQETSRDDIEGRLDNSGSGDSIEEVSGSGSDCDDLCLSKSGVSPTTTMKVVTQWPTVSSACLNQVVVRSPGLTMLLTALSSAWICSKSLV